LAPEIFGCGVRYIASTLAEQINKMAGIKRKSVPPVQTELTSRSKKIKVDKHPGKRTAKEDTRPSEDSEESDIRDDDISEDWNESESGDNDAPSVKPKTKEHKEKSKKPKDSSGPPEWQKPSMMGGPNGMR
jgi:hypothetical protein